jgi:hypothetical protein
LRLLPQPVEPCVVKRIVKGIGQLSIIPNRFVRTERALLRFCAVAANLHRSRPRRKTTVPAPCI